MECARRQARLEVLANPSGRTGMKALVVYESMYGNTAAVGDAIAASLRSEGLEVEAGLVSKFDPDETADVDVLVVGGPTHVHGMSRSNTRKTAVEDEKNTFPDRTVEPGLRDWVEHLPPGAGRLAAAFDTRIDKPVILTGSAAKGIGRRLERRGFRLVGGPECFFVSTQNRLLDGEVERATNWAKEVAERAT
jgi:flavodoxin